MFHKLKILYYNIYILRPKYTMECIICFDPIDIGASLNHIKCRNKSCTAIMCIECMRNYINISINEKKIPKCPNITCGRYYFLSDVNNFADLRIPYAKCCFNEILGIHGDIARKTVEIKNNVETLRNLRYRFINERFPPAISYTASVIMPHKLKHLDKQVLQKIQENTMKTYRTCMNLTCTGSLNENFTCLSCDTSFCVECEKRKHPGHVCNANDIESIRSIRDMIHCPKCHFPIIKSEGCDNMTCANCNQVFLYSTGEIGGHGSHVTKIATQKTKILHSVVYGQSLRDLGLFNLVVEIESLEPTSIDSSNLVNILIHYYKNNQVTTPQLELDLATAFQKYNTKLLINKRFHQALTEIETRILNNTINQEFLSQIFSILNQPI